MKTIISEKNEIFDLAASRIKALMDNKPDAVLALCGGRSVQGLYERLLGLHLDGELSFSRGRVFAVSELLDVPEHMRCHKTIFEDFLSRTDIKSENVHFPDIEDMDAYERHIESVGGIDLAVLGIGENAHIGYNEPATPFSSLCHVQKLTDATKRQLEKQYGAAFIPERAFTMGIKTITQAGDIMLLAFGEEKADAVHKMLYGRNDSVVPAAFLQIPMNVTVYLDEPASSQL